MIVCRTFTLLFLLCTTACGVCSSLFPLFRRAYDVDTAKDSDALASADSHTMYHRRETVYYWYTEQTTSGTYPDISYSRHYNNARRCDSDKMYFVVSSALSTAGASMGGIACIMAAAWVYAGFDSCLHSFIVFVTFISFACFVVTVALVSYAYTNDTCTNSANRVTALKNASPKFAVVEGFILLCVAAGGMLVALTLEALSFCVCTTTDDYCGGRSNASRGSSSSSRHVEDDRSVQLSDGSVLLIGKGPRRMYRTSSELSRVRGEGSMSRRSSSSSLSRASSSSSMGSSGSTRSGSTHRTSRSGHRRPLR